MKKINKKDMIEVGKTDGIKRHNKNQMERLLSIPLNCYLRQIKQGLCKNRKQTKLKIKTSIKFNEDARGYIKLNVIVCGPYDETLECFGLCLGGFED